MQRKDQLREQLCAAVIAMIALLAAAGARAQTITVNDRSDPGSGSTCTLHEAIKLANASGSTGTCAETGSGAPTINFAAGLASETVTLSSVLPTITASSLTIVGPTNSPSGITIDGASDFQVMIVGSGAVFVLNNLTIADGNSAASNGAGIDNAGTLTVSNCGFSDNMTQEIGPLVGGSENESGATLTVTNSTFAGNSAFASGAIENDRTITVANSTFSQNSATGNERRDQRLQREDDDKWQHLQ